MDHIRTNRIRFVGLLLIFAVLGDESARAQNEYEKQSYTTPMGNVLPYRILYPLAYNPAQKYPLVVVLHGAGERGSDNEKQLALGSDLFTAESKRHRFPAIVIFPQCPTDNFWASVKIDRHTTPYTINFDYNDQLNWPMQAVVDLVQQFKRKGLVDKNRLYLMGLSMGGFGVFETVARYPDLFTAAVPICGGGNPDFARSYAKKVRFWVFHGSSDQVVNVAYSRQMVVRLKELGADVQYTEYPGVDHESWEPALAEPQLLEWLFGKK